VMPPERAQYRHGEDTVVVSYARQRDGRFAVTVTGAGPARDGAPESGEPVTLHHAGDGWIEFDAGGQRHRLHVLAAGDQVWVQGPDGDVALTAVPRFPESGRGDAVAGGLVAPMPGTVLAVHVGPGDTVAQGQLLMIVEAMKMEHRITAPAAGTVSEVRARPGDQVNGGDLLAVLDEAS
jgi:acyl-CoA carboxylase subunit alpha